MSTSDLKLSPVERLLLEQDVAFLNRLRDLFDRRARTDVDFTDEEVAELEELRAQRLRGEGQGISMEEAMRIARERIRK